MQSKKKGKNHYDYYFFFENFIKSSKNTFIVNEIIFLKYQIKVKRQA